MKEITGLSLNDLNKIKKSLKNTMLYFNKDLNKSLKKFDYDEIHYDLESLNDYLETLKKVAFTIQYRSNKKW